MKDIIYNYFQFFRVYFFILFQFKGVVRTLFCPFFREMLNLRHITISTKRFLHLSPLQGKLSFCYIILCLARGPLVYPGWYPRDHKPGLYPETPEDYRAAAIKYGLRPEDYK